MDGVLFRHKEMVVYDQIKVCVGDTIYASSKETKMKCKYWDRPCGWDEEWWFDGDCTHCSEYLGYIDQIGQF